MDVTTAIKEVGLSKVARACSRSPSTVHKWQSRNRLPRTDYTGETAYAARIAELHGHVTPEQLLTLAPPAAQS